MLPKLSIVIPTYNRVGIVSETLSSVINQSFHEFECLVIDDFSSDGTTEIVSEFAKRDNRIQLFINKENKGACYTRNRGTKLSKTDMVCFLDSDDIWDSKYLEEQYKSLLNYPDASAAICKTLRFSGNISNISKPYGLVDYPITLARYLNCQIGWSTSAVLWRKGCLQSLGGFSEELDMWQDWELNIRFLAANKQVAITNHVLTYYRDKRDNKQITSSKDSKAIAINFYLSIRLAFEKARNGRILDLDTSLALKQHFQTCLFKTKENRKYYEYLISLFIFLYLRVRVYSLIS